MKHAAAPVRPDRSRRFIPVLLILAGIVVLLYPVAGTFYNNYRQFQFAQQYQDLVGTASAQQLDDQLARARAYNERLGDHALLDPWGQGGPEQSPEYADYLAQLDLGDTMARLRVPSIRVDQPVRHGTSDDVLNRGVGHLFGTHLPVGGIGTHAALTAHTGLTEASMFDSLVDVTEGDVFYVDVAGETLAYQVDRIDVVLPTELDRLEAVEGEDLLTLVTCTPYGVNSHRLLVRGHRIPYDASTDPGSSSLLDMDWTIQPWMIPRLIGAGIALGLLLLMTLGWVVQDSKYRRAVKAHRRAAAATPSASTETQ